MGSFRDGGPRQTPTSKPFIKQENKKGKPVQKTAPPGKKGEAASSGKTRKEI